MSLHLQEYVIGNMANNTYLLTDTETNQALLIDPAMGISEIMPEIKNNGWQISEILLTHAHFDHTYGIYELQDNFPTLPPIALHTRDQTLYNGGGLGELMGLHRAPLPAISHWLKDEEIIQFGSYSISVRHCPGHTPGHVLFYVPELQSAFVGDCIFRRSVGRTDLPGGSHEELIHTIKEKIFTLPKETRLLSGHGASTTVEEEMQGNPFLID